MGYRGYPFSKTTYYRRLKKAARFGCSLLEVPDGRGKHDGHASGPDHYRWNSGRLLKSDGYVLVRVGTSFPWADSNGYLMEHVLIMCSAIGRPLSGDEVIHHINGQKTDNRLENLRLMSNSAHLKLHRALAKRDSDGSRELDGRRAGR